MPLSLCNANGSLKVSIEIMCEEVAVFEEDDQRNSAQPGLV
jgi:hypothetical protein